MGWSPHSSFSIDSITIDAPIAQEFIEKKSNGFYKITYLRSTTAPDGKKILQLPVLR